MLCRTACYWLAACHRLQKEEGAAARLEGQATAAPVHRGRCDCLQSAGREAYAIAYHVGVRAARRAGHRDNATAIQFNELAGETSRQNALLDEYIIPEGVTVRSAWLTRDVLALAGHANDLSTFGVLADALEEAGCTEQALLGHLRGAGPHRTGCWAISLLELAIAAQYGEPVPAGGTAP